MAVKIRMRQQGRHGRPFYRVVVADVHSPRDGKYIESLGWYNPFAPENQAELSIDAERLSFWLNQGAQLTDKTAALAKRAAPEVMKNLNEKVCSNKIKTIAKRKARRKNKSA